MEVTEELITRNSFIANVNLLVRKLQILQRLESLFSSKEEIESLIKLLDIEGLEELIKDLMKQSDNGNRKLDINVLYNLKSYDAGLTTDELILIWQDRDVYYNKAVVAFTDTTNTITVNFTMPRSDNTGIYNELVANNDLVTALKNTIISLAEHPVTTTLVRFTDKDNMVCNVKSVTLFTTDTTSQYANNPTPIYDWLNTTSGIEVVANYSSLINDFLNKYPEMMSVYKRLDELLEIIEGIMSDAYIEAGVANLQETFALTVPVASGNVLTLPIYYYPLRNILFVSYNGVVCHKRSLTTNSPYQYEEIGNDLNTKSNQILLLFDASVGDEFMVWVVSSATGRNIQEIQDMHDETVNLLGEANEAVDRVEDFMNNYDTVGIPAEKITSGIIDIARIPAAALEHIVNVADDTARFALTTVDVQKGDIVYVESTKIMYTVVDETQLNTEAGYLVHSAGTAASVAWSGITDKPTTFIPSSHASSHNVGGTDVIAVATASTATANGSVGTVTYSSDSAIVTGTSRQTAVTPAGLRSVLGKISNVSSTGGNVVLGVSHINAEIVANSNNSVFSLTGAFSSTVPIGSVIIIKNGYQINSSLIIDTAAGVNDRSSYTINIPDGTYLALIKRNNATGWDAIGTYNTPVNITPFGIPKEAVILDFTLQPVDNVHGDYPYYSYTLTEADKDKLLLIPDYTVSNTEYYDLYVKLDTATIRPTGTFNILYDLNRMDSKPDYSVYFTKDDNTWYGRLNPNIQGQSFITTITYYILPGNSVVWYINQLSNLFNIDL